MYVVVVCDAIDVKGRIVLFGTGFTEPGGCARHASILAHGLAARGWRVIAVCRTDERRAPNIASARRLRMIEVPGFGSRIGAGLFLAVALPIGLLWGRRARFITFQLSSPTLAGGMCSQLLRRPFLALATTSGEEGEVAEILGSPGRWPYRRLLARASYIVGQTPVAAEELQRLAAPGRVAVIPTPVPDGEQAPLSGRPNALYAGRLTHGKDLPILLEAWESLIRDHPEARLTFVGDGDSRRSVEGSLRRTVSERPGLAQSVRFAGWVRDVAHYLAESDVFAFPSRGEGMSNSLLEACAWRRVVVASDIPPNRAVLGDDYPLLFPVGDAPALAEALARAFDDDSLRADALRRIEDRLPLFSPDNVLDRLEALLNAADRPRH